MSYFVFGCVIAESPLWGHLHIVTAAEGEAARQGLHVFWDEKIPQGVIREMLDEQVGQEPACAFLITSRAGEDTSDSLISPFERSSDQISEALAALERWADGLLWAVPGIAISFFFTEGYETAFCARKGAVPGWALQIAQLVADEGDIPSLRIDLTATPRT
jgi:hypothetical protein